MDRFKEMQVFVRVAERKSFTLAAEDLLIPRPTITNLIKRLEQRLGTRLLERTTRQVNVTHDGEVYYKRCISLLSDLEEMEHVFSSASTRGILRVNLQGTLAMHFVMPFLDDFLTLYPDIMMHVAEDDRIIDLVKEGIDCVLRAGELKDSSLIAKRIAQIEQVTVASPKYIGFYGKPNSIADIHQHRVVGYSLVDVSKTSTLDFTIGKEIVEVNLPTLITVAGADLYTGAAKAGLGIIQVPKYRIAKELETGALIELLQETPPPKMPVSILYPQNKHLSTRTRVFIEWLAKQFEKHAI
ncbi:LysR family transcriptional regulator [Psychromonas algicola]|uniref:LysR substrate-binding domain-containing protein n=1 Tax=Psychromonas algicola TaxID=2555642 RepID=UPI001068148D|nr:LysR family transcriptional regulator [Psychromonas sp. RZ5]TEW52111.1 LysR family transcriptional regulator [Psychromonas sp. RZ5]